jgi:deoxyadenosine/deoxycytidine kinase
MRIMQPKPKYYLTVMGTMGSGKTTAARLIAKTLNLNLLEENFGDNAFLPRFYTDMKRWAFHSQTFFLMEKINQMLATGAILTKSAVVQDTPIDQDVFSYAKAQHVLGNIDDAEWRLYQKIYQSFIPYFPKPDLIIYLKTDLKVIFSRLKARGRSYESQIPESYVELLDMLNQRWINANCEIPILAINTDELNIVNSSKAKQEFMDKVINKIESIKL